MYHWRAVYKYRRKFYYAEGLFRYEKEEHAIREFNLIGEMFVFKLYRKVPAQAELIGAQIITEKH